MRRSRRLATFSALALTMGLGAPAVAGAARKDVSLGPPRSAQRSLQTVSSDVNDFFPHRVTIHVGDTVRFVPSGFHTVDLPGRRTRKLPIIAPVGPAIAGAVDAAGAPFWFNGQPGLGFNPTMLRSAFGKRRSYSGARAVLSGLPVQQRPRPMTVRFTRAGRFRYFCDVHPGMTGIVRVVGSGRRIPSRAADRRTLRRQVARTLATARALAKAPGTPPANTVDVGAQARGRVSFFAFVPSALTVPTGTTVTFRMNASTELHTATTGPGDPENQPQSYLGQIEAGLQGPALDPRGVFPSEPPGALAALTPGLHGNGFWNSGALDLDPTTPVPPANAVTFAAPGTYQVFCMIHPFMHATVTVT
jgi:plastocyanin